jgi:hypothetical protein
MIAIPKQPSAGKIQYTVTLYDADGNKTPLTDTPVTIRFKDPVPLTVLIPHVAIMFFGMLFSTRAGLEGVVGRDGGRRLAIVTLVLLTAGGLIFGPIVQKFAFGAYWTGWPFGHDLTDNKTAVAVLAWVLAVWRSRGNRGRGWLIAAAVITLAIYLIPHSLLGSELDYTQSGN